ncbi:MAG: 50S ribosomal protein L24 [Parachlamydiales bacterium]|nr:50S ribosomal protein L24 [Parachlamydiales bacterium]
MKQSVKKGSRVLVIAGNDRGKSGEVIGRSEDRVLVQGVNIRKKHMKRTQQTQGGRVIEMEVPIHISNVCLCDKDGNRLKKAKQQAPEKEKTEKASARASKKVKNV